VLVEGANAGRIVRYGAPLDTAEAPAGFQVP
jgi:hypothetical protein